MFINVLNTCKRFDGNCNTFPAGRLSFTVDNTFLILYSIQMPDTLRSPFAWDRIKRYIK